MKSFLLHIMLKMLPRGHSITKHTGGGGGGGGLARRFKKCLKNANIIPLNIIKVQFESSKISNLEQIFIFTYNCTINYPCESF